MLKPVTKTQVAKNIFNRTGPRRNDKNLAKNPPIIAAGAANNTISHMGLDSAI